jgi:hypothetical protein
MKKIILCTPRSGSTCAIKWLRKESQLLHTSHEEPFLHNNNPIEFLESERKLGNEYCYKVHVHQIKKHINWFQNFYKFEEIYILKRRNLWNQYLSHLYQHENKWKLTWCENPLKIDKTPKEAINYKNTLKLFLTWQYWLDDFNYDTIYYEDIEWKTSLIKFSKYINYEEYFTNIEEIKSYYEVLYHWYEKGSWEIVERHLPDSLFTEGK